MFAAQKLKIAVVDAEVRRYEAVVNRVRPGLKAALEVAT